MTPSRLPGPDADGKYGRDYVLDFVGKFAQVQFHIDTALNAGLQKFMPVFGPVVANQFIDRIRDEQRSPLIIALAREIGYSGDLGVFKSVFERAKSARDLFGHAHHVADAWDPISRGWIVSVATTRKQWPRSLPRPLVVDSIKGLIADCEWMSDLVTRLLFEMGWKVFALDVTDYEPQVPPATPPNGLLPMPSGETRPKQGR